MHYFLKLYHGFVWIEISLFGEKLSHCSLPVSINGFVSHAVNAFLQRSVRLKVAKKRAIRVHAVKKKKEKAEIYQAPPPPPHTHQKTQNQKPKTQNAKKPKEEETGGDEM